MTARQLTTFSSLALVGAYVLIFCCGYFNLSTGECNINQVTVTTIFYFILDYYLYVQTLFGSLLGMASGVGYSTVNIVTQQWFDKKRDVLNPYIMLGSPVCGMIATPLFTYLCDVYSWTGAVLIIIGILFHCLIVIVLYAEHPDYVPPKEKVSLCKHLNNPDLVGHPLFKCVLGFNLVQTACILIPYFTQTVNIASEYGLTSNEILIMVMAGTLTECLCRPFIGHVCKLVGISRLATLWSLVFFIQNCIGCLATTPLWFHIMGAVLGIGMAGGVGMKMVLIMECLGKDNLRSYIGMVIFKIINW